MIHFLFPQLPKNHPANKHITTNIIANILGLGWAATPAGLQAMEELAKLEESRRSLKGIASNEMCNFLILNISSLQLIPVNVIAYRSQYGSVNPASIVGAGIIATSISTLAGIVYFKIRTGSGNMRLFLFCSEYDYSGYYSGNCVLWSDPTCGCI